MSMPASATDNQPPLSPEPPDSARWTALWWLDCVPRIAAAGKHFRMIALSALMIPSMVAASPGGHRHSSRAATPGAAEYAARMNSISFKIF